MIQAYAAFEPHGKLKPFAYDPGPLPPDEVEIDVLSCGICHSDLSILDNAWGISQFPVVAGHEVVGTIARTGTRTGRLAVGQTVGLGWHAGYCNDCPSCRSGDHNLCAAAQPTIVGHHGGFADKVRAAANSVVPLPPGIDPESAGPLLCGGITVFNPLVQFGVSPTDRVAVIGIGGLGHLALRFLHAWGCEVTAFTSSEAKREEALALGARHTLDSRDPEALRAAAGRFDLVLSQCEAGLEPLSGNTQAAGPPALPRRHPRAAGHRRVLPDPDPALDLRFPGRQPGHHRPDARVRGPAPNPPGDRDLPLRCRQRCPRPPAQRQGPLPRGALPLTAARHQANPAAGPRCCPRQPLDNLKQFFIRNNLIMGPVYFFGMAREASLRRLRWKDLEGRRATQVAGLRGEHVDALLAGLSKPIRKP